MFTTETKFIARYAETDQMGIVHHSNYPVWFEAGRTDFIRKMGMPYSTIEANGILLPLTELKCCYKAAAKYEDEITVKTSIKELTKVRITFYYEVFRNGDTTTSTTGETVHVWTNKELKPVILRKYSPQIYDILCKALDM